VAALAEGPPLKKNGAFALFWAAIPVAGAFGRDRPHRDSRGERDG
jgi:hypothetical protein